MATSPRFGGSGGGGSSAGLTYYGPNVPGDQPGGPTYDWDSYHGIGHIHGVAHSLTKGLSAAMHPEYAARTYPGLQPGGMFKSRRDGKMHQWDDTTGGGPNNEDM